MMVFMLLITEQIPATSDVVPLIAKFYMAVVLEMSLALVITCYVIRCYHSHTSEIPRWMREILVKKLAKFFGIKKSKELKEAEKEREKLSQLQTGSAADYEFVRSLVTNNSMKRSDKLETDDNGNNVLDHSRRGDERSRNGQLLERSSEDNRFHWEKDSWTFGIHC